MPFYIIRQDICRMNTDAIVNAANESLKRGGGVCGAIFNAAGAEKLQNECDRIGHVDTGSAVITSGCSLPARYIIHTAGPIYSDGKHGEEKLLRSCYSSSLELAEKHSIRSIAFPLISAGIYGYPKQAAFRVAAETILRFLEDSDMTVYLILFDLNGFGYVTDELKSYIDDNYVSRMNGLFGRTLGKVCAKNVCGSVPLEVTQENGCYSADALDDIIRLNKDEDFQHMLFRLIDERGLKDSEVYKRANLDRKLFSKIRCTNSYKPSKNTALALAVGLKLDIDQTLALLRTAGYTLSNSSYTDLIVRYHIERKLYDIYEINFILFDYGEDPLGGKKMSL